MSFGIAATFFSITILVYAAALMALLLDLRPLKLPMGKRVLFFGVMAAIILVNFLSVLYYGAEVTGKYYMLTAQLPVFLLFLYVSRQGWLPVVFATLTAIFLTFPLMLSKVMVGRLLNGSTLGTIAVAAGVCTVCIYFVVRFLQPGFLYMLGSVRRAGMLRFCAVPFLYNVISYALGKYNYSASMPIDTLPIRILVFLMTLAVYFLLLDVYKSTREKEVAQREQEVLFLQLKASRQRVEELKNTQEQARYYRHDMRHHLSLLGGYLADGDLERMRQYMQEVQKDIEAITPTRYCENETVNLILSSFLPEANRRGARLCVDASVPIALPIGDTELCAILSNAVENALAAVGAVDDGRERVVRVECHLREGKLLVMVQNPYAREVVLEDGVPKSQRVGHGFGTKSTISIVEKHGGLISYTAEEGTFTVRMVL